MDELRKGIAIGMLFGSGGHGNLMTKTATENGVYTAAEEINPETGEIFNPPKDGYSVFTVDLALDDKSVSLTTSQITGSQTAVFEYDPHDENPELEGYSLFTIDLSAVKDDIEDLQQRVSDLEDELEACHDCWEEVVAALQQYDPNYDPDEGECPADKVTEVVDKEKELEEQVEECDECKAAVIAKLQEYDPNFDPVTCSDIPPEIGKIVDENKGVVVPDGVDPGPIAVQLGANTQAQATIDGKTISVSLSGYGYYAYGPPAENYTPVENDNPILEYLSAFGSNMPLYTAYDEAPAPTSYAYRTYMYAVTLEGFPTMYTFNSASNNPIDATFYVAELALSGSSNSTLSVKNYSGGTLAYVTAATGKSFTTDGTVKII